MEIFHLNSEKANRISELPEQLPAGGFFWIDSTHDEVSSDPEAWRDSIARIAGVQIDDLHLSDLLNLKHPSYFDSTHDYAMVVFRKLQLGGPLLIEAPTTGSSRRKLPSAFGKLTTIPIGFVVIDRILVTVHQENSRIIDAAKTRLLDQRQRPEGSCLSSRPPASPTELMLRLLNAMVDQYLELRQPLSAQLDRWQRALLNPKRRFNDWVALLDARNELHRLERLSEEQLDALQELRDHIVDAETEHTSREHHHLLVRLNDVMEHITRVLHHSRRLESSLESAVQIHFASVSHRTSEIMRTLTALTALFMPLTLITGIFGMNFVHIPLTQQDIGFWIVLGAMLVLVLGLLGFFAWRRYFEE